MKYIVLQLIVMALQLIVRTHTPYIGRKPQYDGSAGHGSENVWYCVLIFFNEKSEIWKRDRCKKFVNKRKHMSQTIYEPVSLPF